MRFTIAIMVTAGLVLSQGASAETSSKSKKPRHQRPAQEEGQIACGKYGCQRIPPNCHPETDYYWNGLPTGYDRVVCR
jgi:hypothetical protein